MNSLTKIMRLCSFRIDLEKGKKLTTDVLGYNMCRPVERVQNKNT
jgi:hypothetical protein